MKILQESDELIIETEYELAVLRNKVNNDILCSADFYGDPTCALISPDNSWAIIAGDYLMIWTHQTQTKINKETLNWIYAMRIKSPQLVEILADPWSEDSAVWELKVNTNELLKIRDFRDYLDKEHTDNVLW